MLRNRPTFLWTTLLASLLGVVAAGDAAQASPLDLGDPTPRWIEVRFEVSPHEAPGRLDQVWGAVRRARFAYSAEEGVIRIRVPADELVEQLRSTGADPIEGSFSDFVWTLDPHTGHVLEAEMSGQLRETFHLGFLRSSAIVDIRVEMTTHRPAGYRPPRNVMGQSAHAYCVGPAAPGECTVVEPSRFDPQRGYVNAVGSLRAATRLAELQTFSPLGEVLFTERPEKPLQRSAFR